MVRGPLGERRKRGRPRIEHQSLGDAERKWCGGCKSWLELTAFRSSVRTWDRLKPRCTACQTIDGRKARQKRAENFVDVPADTIKRCSTCKAEKPLSDFRRQKCSALGRQSRCRACSDVYNDRWRTRRRPERLAYNREYYGTERGREVIGAWLERNPGKAAAQKLMWNAIKAGRLVKPDACEACDSTGRLDGHHPDYSRPLDVMWLCRSCHKGWHRKHGEGLNAKSQESGICAAG